MPKQEELDAFMAATGETSEKLARFFRCGYAINTIDDEIRELKPSQRRFDKITDEAKERFVRGEFADKCGKASSIIILCWSLGCVPYCAEHFCADAALTDHAEVFCYLSTFTKADRDLLRKFGWGKIPWFEFKKFCQMVNVFIRHREGYKAKLVRVRLHKYDNIYTPR